MLETWCLLLWLGLTVYLPYNAYLAACTLQVSVLHVFKASEHKVIKEKTIMLVLC